MQWDIREVYPSDENYIKHTWFKAVSAHRFKLFKRSAYELLLNQDIKEAFESAEKMVCCSQNDKTLIFGFIIYEPELLHLVYVKNLFRNFGIATELYRRAYGTGSPREAANFFPNCDWLKKHAPEIVFNPFWREERRIDKGLSKHLL